jgi:Cdc6-like AAA superfamily ATPase
MDSRIGSTVAFNSLGIENYTQAQIADILAERARIGLTPGSWDMDIINVCASKSAQKRGNVHFGLELLLKAAKEAEGANRHRIEMEDVEGLWGDGTDEGAANPAGSKALPGLTDGEQLIMDILKDGETDTVSLYGAFNGKMQRSGRQIRNYLKSLENKELIMMRAMEGVGTVGNKRFVRLGCGND